MNTRANKRRNTKETDASNKVPKYDDVPSGININQLPESLLLQIFSYLQYHELCKIKRVCKNWKRIANDPVFKKTIVLNKPLKQRYMNKFNEKHFNEDMIDFRLLNPVTYPGIFLFDRESCLQLSTKCKKLKKLDLVRCIMMGALIEDLPSSLKHLNLDVCKISNYFFRTKPCVAAPQLTCLILNDCYSFQENFSSLSYLKSLTSLIINDITVPENNEILKSLLEILPKLQVLGLSGICLANEEVRIILKNCVKIEELFICSNYQVNDQALDPNLRACVPNLSHFCVRNTRVTQLGLDTFFSESTKTCSVKIESKFYEYITSFNPTALACKHYLSHKCPVKENKKCLNAS